MPLIPCPDCRKEISDHADACLHCGRPMAARPTDPGRGGMTRAEMAQAVKEGEQRAEGRRTIGCLMFWLTVGLFVVAAAADSPRLAAAIVVVGFATAGWITYGW